MVSVIKGPVYFGGDSNMRYIHGIANGRHRKKRIHSLVQDEEQGQIERHEQLKSYITNYCKGPFGLPKESLFSLYETLTNDIPQVYMEENGLLIAPCSEEEVQKAIFQMERNKAPGLNNFLVEFYQTF
jgi:mannosylglycoprotein endo-beta-mannosidase